MSGIIQRKSTPSGIASPSADSVFMGVDTSGVFYTKDESGTVTVYPTEGGTFTGGTVSTLNIDFTDNLQFKSNPSLDSANIDPIYEAKLVGEFLGFEESGSISGYTATSYNGIFDGILDIAGGFAQLPSLFNVQTFTVTDGAVGSILKYQGLTDYTPFGGGISLVDQNSVTFSGASGSTEFAINRQHDLDNEESQMQIGSIISYPDVDETSEQYVIKFNGLTNGNDAEMQIRKNVSSNIIDESIIFGIAGYTTGFEISNNLADNIASLFKVKDNTDTNIFDVRNDGVTVSSLSATTLSSTTLNIDFTDSMDFFTGNQAVSIGETYIPFVGWVPIQFSGEGIGSRLVKDDHEFYQFVSEGEAELQGLGLTFPGEQANSVLLIKSGTYSGSVMTNGLLYVDQSGLGGNVQYQNQMYGFFVDTDTDERNSYSIAQLVNSSGNGLFIGKTNNDGETIDLAITDTSTGFEIYNDLSDDTASLFKILNNNGDVVFDVKNDGAKVLNQQGTFSIVPNDLNDDVIFLVGDTEFNSYMFITQQFGTIIKAPTSGFTGSILQVTDDENNSIFSINPPSGDGQVNIIGDDSSTNILRVLSSGFTDTLFSINQSGSTTINSIATTGSSENIFTINRPLGNSPISISSENSTSILDAILIFSDSLPTSASGLSNGQIYTQTSAELGGSGSTKVLCIA